MSDFIFAEKRQPFTILGFGSRAGLIVSASRQLQLFLAVMLLDRPRNRYLFCFLSDCLFRNYIRFTDSSDLLIHHPLHPNFDLTLGRFLVVELVLSIFPRRDEASTGLLGVAFLDHSREFVLHMEMMHGNLHPVELGPQFLDKLAIGLGVEDMRVVRGEIGSSVADFADEGIDGVDAPEDLLAVDLLLCRLVHHYIILNMQYYSQRGRERSDERMDATLIFYGTSFLDINSTQRMQQFIQMNKTLFLFLLAVALIAHCSSLHIESRKYSVIENGEQVIPLREEGVDVTITFNREFDEQPEVGLSIYNLQLSYNPNFAVKVQGGITTTQCVISVTGKQSSQVVASEIFVMFIASDYVERFSIYRVEDLNTTEELGVPDQQSPRKMVIPYNFKYIGTQTFFTPTTSLDNIKLTIYLTGVKAEGETIENGYARNYISILLEASVKTFANYEVSITIQDIAGDILIKGIDFTVIYFDTKVMNQGQEKKYIMNSGDVPIRNFGGTYFKSSTSVELAQLTYQDGFETNLQYFFGVAKLECQEGSFINLLAVERFNYNNQGKLLNIFLTFETKRNVFHVESSYDYIQYKEKCNPFVCNVNCSLPSTYRPDPQKPDICELCFYSCLTCQDGPNGGSICETCPASRVLDNSTSLCKCSGPVFFDDFFSLECQSCFDEVSLCRSCSSGGVCIECYEDFRKNTVLRTCECAPGSYNNMNSSEFQEVQGLEDFTEKQDRLQVIIEGTCALCPSECIYCTNQTNCEACTLPFYLNHKHRVINQVVETCVPICNSNQVFNERTWKCSSYSEDTSLFNQRGRLGFDWDYTNENNELLINLVFSQRDVEYFYYENSVSYSFQNSAIQERSRDGQSSLFYDDGNGYINGYSEGGNVVNGFSSSSTSTQDISGNFRATSSGSGLFDDSALRGEYYGLGEAEFFKREYQRLESQYGKARYFDQYSIPFGKHQLKNESAAAQNLYLLEAVRNNLDFTIGGESLPYTINAVSGNEFQLIVRPDRSYLMSDATLAFKNPALVRSNGTALQTPEVTKQIDRLDYYSVAQLRSAQGLRDRVGSIIQILWGVCKYLLFVGLGWPVMPLMLIMQYIMGHNYISTQLPLNLDYFLASFSDFRNPSILFNPERNNFDRDVLTHEEIYQRVSAFQEFDRGIDFMKNSFQFFFVPFLSFALLGILLLVNLLVNCCGRDLPFISGYLKPRWPLHLGAYTLVQALPISFFFFGQLQDTRYNHVKLSSSQKAYPIFNTSLAYLAFFLTAIIPLIILTATHNYFKRKSRTGIFSLEKFKNKDDGTIKVEKDPVGLGDPIWSSNQEKSTSFGFGAYIFYLPLLVGFFLAYFIRSYGWQLVGLILGFLGLLAFAAGSNHFNSKVTKYYFAATGGLMVAYQLVHAGIGSNRALSTYDQWNTGYVGIGIIFALLLIAVLFSAYLLSKAIKTIYDHHIKPGGCLPKKGNRNAEQDEKVADRIEATGREKERKETLMRSAFMSTPAPDSEERIFHKQTPDIKYTDQPMQREALILLNKNPNGRATYRAQNSGGTYAFPVWSSNLLAQSQPLTIDGQQDRHIFSKTRKDLGALSYLQSQMIREKQKEEDDDEEDMMYQAGKGEGSSRRMIMIQGKEMNYDQDGEGNFRIINSNGEIIQRVTGRKFLETLEGNGGKVQYKGQEYEVESDEDEDYFWLVNANNRGNREKVTRQELMTIIGNHSRSEKKVTSIMHSKKTIKSSEEEANMFQKGRDIAETNSRKEFFIIDGEQYEKKSETSDQITFYNPLTKKTITRSKKDLNNSISQTISHKTISEKVIFNMNGGDYELVGRGADGYQFINVLNGEKKVISQQEYYRVTGSRDMPQTRTQKIVRRNLRFVGKSSDNSSYIFEDQLEGLNYEVPIENVKSIEEIYIDDKGQLWNGEQKLEFEEEEIEEEGQFFNNKNTPKEQTRMIENSFRESNNLIESRPMLSSATSINYSENLNPMHSYNLVFFDGKHVFKEGEELSYEEGEVLTERKGVPGRDVQGIINSVKRNVPEAKVLIFDEDDEDSNALILEGKF